MISKIASRINRKVLIAFFLSIFFGIVFVVPQLHVNELTPLDYEESLMYGQVESVTSALVISFNESSRFRPLYNLKRYFMYTFFGTNSRWYYLINGFVLGLTIFLSWSLVERYRYKDLFFLIAIIFLLPSSVDNFFRLGTAEPLYSFLLILSLFLLVKDKIFLFGLSFFLLLLSKENSFLIGPIMLGFLYVKYAKKRYLSLLVIYLFLLFALIMRYLNLGKERYASEFAINLSKNIANIWKYILSDWPTFVVLSIITILYLFLRKHRKKIQQKVFLLLLISWASIPPLALNWEHYYVFPTMLLVFILLLRTVNSFKIKSSQEKYIYLFLPIIFAFGQFNQTLKLARQWHAKQIGDSALTRFLVSNKSDVDKSPIYFFNHGMQNNEGSWMILSDFGKRDVNFHPSVNALRNEYEARGIDGVNSMVDATEELFFSSSKGSILVAGPCSYKSKPIEGSLPICSGSLFLKQPQCFWCVVVK